jgi:hypothetical protein
MRAAYGNLVVDKIGRYGHLVIGKFPMEEIEMPTLPWTPATAPAAGGSVVMASRFELRSLRHVLPFFVDAMRVFALVRRSPGAVGVTLEAHPLRKEFWTLSQWADRASLDAMVGTEPHRTIMGRYHAAMADAGFVFWEQPAEAPPTWDEARRRLAAS